MGVCCRTSHRAEPGRTRLAKMTVMFQRSPAQTNGNLPKGERKRSMPPPVSTSPPLKKAKTLVVKEEEQKEKEEKEESVIVTRESGGLVSQGSQTLPPSSQIGSSCKLHGDEEEEVCPIGTPVNLPATVWYEDRDGLLVVNVTWRGRTYVGTLMDSTKSEHIAEQYSGRIRQSNEKETESSQKRVEEEFEEEEEPLPEKSLRERKTNKPKVKVKREKSKEKEEKKMYRCEKCDKEYKYPSGLSYHNKNTHEKIRTERESV